MMRTTGSKQIIQEKGLIDSIAEYATEKHSEKAKFNSEFVDYVKSIVTKGGQSTFSL